APASLLTTISEWCEYIPILVSGVESFIPHRAEIQKQIVGCFKSLPSYAELTHFLDRCYICRSIQKGGHEQFSPNTQFYNLVGKSQQIETVRKLIYQVSKKDANVLITGESGTGKEVVAVNLHRLSHRADKPFIPVNCGAIPAELLESELFGHEKGAFTGAITTRQGRFELASGGTIFLDEIGDMPLNMQVKLLRVLQEKTFERVGSSKSIEADVRIIAATHQNLEKLVEEGKFREDLYYRLNVFPIEMPSLKNRTEDIELLVKELVSRFEKTGEGSVRLSTNALHSLSKHSWPGNIRELFNLVERLIILYPYSVVDSYQLPEKYQYEPLYETESLPEIAKPLEPKNKPDSAIKSEDELLKENLLPSSEALSENGMDLKDYLTQIELNYIKQALKLSNGVVAKAAQLLKIRRTTLVEKMRKFNLQRISVGDDC
ncbi:MAG: sigma-54 dependent transcriptional regulator, partial [Pseudomonadota bacterium]